jgi:hypothetical protein
MIYYSPYKHSGSRKHFLFIILLSILMTSCNQRTNLKSQETGAISWPEITAETKPWTRWWWHGSAVNKEELTASLEAFKEAGLGGVEITPIYGTKGEEERFIEYLSPEWMEMLTHTLEEARRLGLGVDMANAAGWPFGGPWVDKEYSSRYFVAKTYQISGGETFSDSIFYCQEPVLRTQNSNEIEINEIKNPVTENTNMQQLALDQVRYKEPLPVVLVTANRKQGNGFEETIDLTQQVKQGRLHWSAPAGEWTICALFMGYHGKMVERAGPGGEGYVIDHFNGDATNHYLNRFSDVFKDYDLSYLRHFFNDSYEVDDAWGESNWTPALFNRFLKLNGYDLRNHIPALLGLDDEEKNSRVIFDYRMTISELILEEFTDRWQKWAASQGKGIRNQAHGSPGNLLDLYAASDIPEIEGHEIVNLKSASSAAHVTGKNLVSAEAATWLNEHFESNLGDIKSALDRFLLSGVNHLFYHGTAYSLRDAQWPGWLFYAAVHLTPSNSLWGDFSTLNNYVTRVQSFLQSGKPSNKILVYFNTADYWSVRGNSMLKHFESRAFDHLTMKSAVDYLTENGYSWDAFSDRQLQEFIYDNGAIDSHGSCYEAILIPETTLMPAATLQKLTELAKSGAAILFIGDIPTDAPGLMGKGKLMEITKEIRSYLHNDNKGSVLTATQGKGRFLISGDIDKLLTSSGIEPEYMKSEGIESIRRQKEDGNYYYFLKNRSDKQYDGWITLQADYTSAAYYNPMTGVDGYALTRQEDDTTALYLILNPGETIIVETLKGRHEGKTYPFYDNSHEVLMLSNWQIDFVKGGPELPHSVRTDKLHSWTDFGVSYQNFSGTAEYTTTLPALPDSHDAWLLRLNEVHESAAVYLNNNYLGTLITSPYEMIIPAGSFTGDDTLKIAVSNLMANHIIYLDKQGVQWKKFYNTNINARRYENRDEKGQFTARNQDPKASGITAPVTLTGINMKH